MQDSSASAIVPSNPDNDLGQLMRLALEKGGQEAVAVLERLVALQERTQARQAAMEFGEALAQFQAECPAITRTSAGRVTTKSGGQYGYTYASLDEIASAIRPYLAPHGLSYTWDTEHLENGSIRVVCRLRHVGGHEQTTSVVIPTESASGMSLQQRVGSAQTYGYRYSLIGALGLASCDPDTDGASNARVTPEQVELLEAKVDEVGADRARFLGFMGVQTMEEIPAQRFAYAMDALNRKKGGR